MLISENQDSDGFTALTPKQREVLELLLEHKTSKEIARVLEISPHTVDQRINFAKQKFGATSRGELATSYRLQKSIYEESIYEESDIDHRAIPLQMGCGSDTSDYLISGNDETEWPADRKNVRLVPEMFEGRFGTMMRLGAIVGIAALLLIAVLVGLAIFQSLSSFLIG